MIRILQDWYDDLTISVDLSRFDPTPLRRRWAFRSAARAAFYRHMAAQCSNEIIVEKALEKYRLQLTKRGKKTVASIIHDIEGRYNNAKALATALEGYVPASELVLINSGEKASNLPVVLERMLSTSETTKKIQRILSTALFPPIVYLWAIWGVLTTVGSQAVPSFLNGNSTANVHGFGYLVLLLSNFVMSPLVVLPPIGSAALTVLMIWSLPRWTGKYRRIADGYFPFSYYRDVQGFLWLLAITSLQSAGMDLKDGLKEQMQLATPWLRERLSRIEWLYGTAMLSFADALAESGYEFPSPGLIDDVASFEEFSDFSMRINQRAISAGNDLEYSTTQKVTWSGLLFELVIFAIIAAITQGISDLANVMG